MQFEFQDPGEGIVEAEIRDILVSAGDKVEEGQEVFVIETDKAAFELSSPHTGTVQEVVVDEGDVVHVGDTLIRFEDSDGEGEEESRSPSRSAGGGSQRAESQKPQAKEKRTAKQEPEAETEPTAEPAQEKGQRNETGTMEGKSKSDSRPGNGDAGDAGARRGRRTRPPTPATPATRRLARELGVDLATVTPSGEGGRATAEDVRRLADGGSGPESEEAPQRNGASSEAQRGRVQSSLPDFGRWGAIERRPLRSVRRTIAERMTRSWETVPHVTHHDVVDITGLERLRRRLAPQVERHGAKLTLTPFLVKALVVLLKRHPRMNSSLDAECGEIVLKQYYNIGIATDTERGLLVPVVHHADALGLAELATRIQGLAERGRAGSLKRSELTGGTFTVTNVGAISGRAFTPIINYPEVAILGLGRAHLANVVQGTLEDPLAAVRYLLPVSLAFDHRVLDGAEVARFVEGLREIVANEDAFLATV